MKKLLVILLLLFPVHGVWGKTISLDCDDTILVLDTNTREVYNVKNKVFGINLREEGNVYIFDMTMPKVKQYARSVGQLDIISIEHSIDTVTSLWRYNMTYASGKEKLIKAAKCKKVSGKRKF